MQTNDNRQFIMAASPISRNNTYSSHDSEESSSSQYDISDLEKDSEILARKAAKRLRPNLTTQSESFVEKIIGWQRKKKIDKIRMLLKSLFPRLKNTELEVRHWLNKVSERKELACQNGRILLTELENQMSVYQKHLDFLDEVVNDIRQIDYDILKEVSELRVAFVFNQELLSRLSPKLSATPEHHVVMASEHTYPLDTHSSGIAAVPSTSSDESKEELLCIRLSGDNGSIVNKPLVADPIKDVPIPVSEPAVWHGSRFGRSDSNPSIQLVEKAKGSPEMISDESPEAKKVCVITPTASPCSTRTLTAIDELNTVAAAECLIWDGAESKRKSLQLGSVSLQSLTLQHHGDLPPHPPTPPLERAVSDGFFTNLRSAFNGSRSRSSTIESSHSERISAPSTPLSTSGGTNTPPLQPTHMTTPKLSRPKSTNGKGKGMFVFPVTAVVSSSSDESNSHSDDNARENGRRRGSRGEGTQQQSGKTSTNVSPPSKRNSTSRPSSMIIDRSKRILSLQNLLAKVDLDAKDATVDPDQMEMMKRINKCLLLKETLKSVLDTIQETQDHERAKLKGMKKMVTELRSIMNGDTEGKVRGDELSSYATLDSQHPPDIIRNDTLTSNPHSHTNLSGYNNSDHYSDDSNSAYALSNRGSRTFSSPSGPVLIPNSHSSIHTLSGSSQHIKIPSLATMGHQDSITAIAIEEGERSGGVTDNSHSTTTLSSSMIASSFMTTATVGSEAHRSKAMTNTNSSLSQLLAQEQLQRSHSRDSLSIGSSTNNSITADDFHDNASDMVDDLRMLISEEHQAKEKLAKLGNLIENAKSIDTQLQANDSTARVGGR